MSNHSTIMEIERLLPSLAELSEIELPQNASKGNGIHPVHGSSTGSNLSIDLDDNRWFCHRCQTGAYSIQFVGLISGRFGGEGEPCKEATNNANFSLCVQEALIYLKEKVQIDISHIEFDFDSFKVSQESAIDVQDWFKLIRDCHNFFKSKMDEKGYAEAKRLWGFTKEQCDLLEIGFAPNTNKALYNQLINLGYSPEEALSTGLISRVTKKDKTFEFDFFRGRLVLPFLLKEKQALYFIARKTGITPENEYEKGKYKKQMIGSSHREYISKLSKQPVFGIETLKPNQKAVIIAEGITDAMTLKLWDIPVISPVTTRFNEKQIDPLKEYIKDRVVIVCFDEEDSLAGLKGAIDTLDLLGEEIDSYLIRLPKEEDEDKLDINEFFKQGNTKEEFQELLEIAMPKEEAMNLKHLFTPPHCIQQIIESKKITVTTVHNYREAVAKELYWNMHWGWKEVRDKLMLVSNHKPNKTTLEQLETFVQELPIDDRVHSCKELIDNHNLIKKYYCDREKCYHISPDFPEEKMVDWKALYEKLLQCQLIKIPSYLGVGEPEFELIFPKELFNVPNWKINFKYNEIDKYKEFSLKYRNIFHSSIEMIGKNLQEKKDAYAELVETWFDNIREPFKKEIAGTINELILEFIDAVDSAKEIHFSWEIEDRSGFNLDKHIYKIEEFLFVPTNFIKEHLENIKFPFTYKKFREKVAPIIIENTVRKIVKIGKDKKRLYCWKLKFNGEQYEIVAEKEKDYLEELKKLDK